MRGGGPWLIAKLAVQGQPPGMRRVADERVVNEQTVLALEVLNAHNSFDHPATLVPKSSDTKLQGSELRCTLAPASVTRLDIRLG